MSIEYYVVILPVKLTVKNKNSIGGSNVSPGPHLLRLISAVLISSGELIADSDIIAYFNFNIERLLI